MKNENENRCVSSRRQNRLCFASLIYARDSKLDARKIQQKIISTTFVRMRHDGGVPSPHFADVDDDLMSLMLCC